MQKLANGKTLKRHLSNLQVHRVICQSYDSNCIWIPSQTSTSPSTFQSPIWLIKIVTCDPLSIEFSFIQAPFPLRQLHKNYPFTGPSQSC